MIPPIWFVELTRIDQANERRRANQTTLNPIESLLGLSEHLGIDDDSILSNAVCILNITFKIALRV